MTKKYTRNIFGQPLFSFYREVIPKWASHCKWTLRWLQNIKLLNIKLCISNWEAPMHRKSLHIIWLDSENGVQFYILPTNKSKQVTLFAPGPLHPGSNWHLETHQYPEDICCNQLNRPEYPNITVFQDAISRQCLETFSSESRNVFGRSWNFPHFPWRGEWLKGNWCALNWLANDRNPKELFQWVLVTTFFQWF